MIIHRPSLLFANGFLLAKVAPVPKQQMQKINQCSPVLSHTCVTYFLPSFSTNCFNVDELIFNLFILFNTVVVLFCNEVIIDVCFAFGIIMVTIIRQFFKAILKLKLKLKLKRALGEMNNKVGRYDYDPTSFGGGVIHDVFSSVTEYVWHTQDTDDGDPCGQSSNSQQSPQHEKTQMQSQLLLGTQSQTQLQSQIQTQQIQLQMEINIKLNTNIILNTIYFQHFEQIFQIAFTILNFNLTNHGIQFMQQILMSHPGIAALIFGIILIMSLAPVQLLIQVRLRLNFYQFISEVLISYWLYIRLDNTEFIGFKLAIFNCIVICLFLLNVTLFFSERMTVSDWFFQLEILLFLFLFGNVCFKIWYFLNSCMGNKESVIRIIGRRRITIGNMVRGVKDR